MKIKFEPPAKIEDITNTLQRLIEKYNVELHTVNLYVTLRQDDKEVLIVDEAENEIEWIVKSEKKVIKDNQKKAVKTDKGENVLEFPPQNTGLENRTRRKQPRVPKMPASPVKSRKANK